MTAPDPRLILLLGLGLGIAFLLAPKLALGAAAVALVVGTDRKAEAAEPRLPETEKREEPRRDHSVPSPEVEEVQLQRLRDLSRKFDWSSLEDGEVQLSFENQTEAWAALERGGAVGAYLFAHVGGRRFVSSVKVQTVVDESETSIEIIESTDRVATDPPHIRPGSVLVGIRLRMPEAEE